MTKVLEIVDQNARSGQGAKGPWSMARVRIEGGQEVYIFNPIKVDDELESYQTEKDGKTFTNWKKKTAATATQNLLQAIYDQNKQILALLSEKVGSSPVKAPESPVNASERDEEPADYTNKVDKVYDVPEDDEPINLDEIPF